MNIRTAAMELSDRTKRTPRNASSRGLSLYGRLAGVLIPAALLALAGCSVSPSDLSAGDAPPRVAAAENPAPAQATTETPQTPAPTAGRKLAVLSRQSVGHGITVARLDNAMTVIVEESHASPVVTALVRVKTGGMYEGPWLGCGISHLLEHLVAKGATRGEGHIQEPQQTRSRVDAIGAQSNAYTSLDNTTYFINCASARAGEAIDILADWIARPEIAREDFEREHGVVQRELEMGRDNTARIMWYSHAANFYRDHPAGVPVIGYLDALRSVTYQDVLDYHARMYTPERMVFVVAGDVDADEAIENVIQSLGDFPAVRSEPVVLPEVPQLTSARRLTVTSDLTKDVSENISFRTITLEHPDLYALDVLAGILGQGQTSRLYRKVLREQQLVTSVSCSSWTPDWGAGNFILSFRCEPGKTDQAEAAILHEVRRLVDSDVDEAELATAKARMKADFVYAQQDVNTRAGRIAGDYMATGDANFTRNYTRRIEAVTVADVRAMAKKYLDTDAMAITRLTPEAAAGQSDQAAARADAPTATMHTLANGLRVVLQPTDTVELTSMALVATGGLLAETPENNGIGTMMTTLSTKGVAGETPRDADRIAEFFENAGGGVSTTCGNNTFVWQASVLSEHSIEAAKVFSDIVTVPSFPESELEILRPRMLAGIRAIGERSTARMQQYFREEFFTGTPWAMMASGSEQAVEHLDRQAVEDHYSHWIKAGSAVLAVYGNFDPEAMLAAIEEGFADLPDGAIQPPAYPARRVAPEGEVHTLKTTYNQATVMMGWPGVTFDSPDRDALTVLETILSGYGLPSGPLHEKLRGRQLVYMVHAQNWPGLIPGTVLAMATTQADKVDEVVNIMVETMQSPLSETFSAEQIDQAVNTIVTVDLLDAQELSSLAMQAALDELYGMGYDYGRSLEKRLRAVTSADLKRVAETYLSGRPVITITTPMADETDGGKDR